MPYVRSSVRTFVTTDIEGSSPKWENPAMPVAHERYSELLREYLGRRGEKFTHGGDAMGFAYEFVQDAIAAVRDLQQALRSEDWSTLGSLPTRVALHSGEAHWDDREQTYHGPTINRLFRLISAGHGGQTLVSEISYQLLSQSALPEGVTLRFLSRCKPRDWPTWSSIYQANFPGLPDDFPPLKAPQETPNNLPIFESRFIGREEEITASTSLLNAYRMVTLFGTGGSGKTRLSIEVARRMTDAFPDGIYQVPLADQPNAERIWTIIASALHLPPSSIGSLTECLLEHLHTKRLLLLLDNCEHLLKGCRTVIPMLLNHCAGVYLLATSREAIGISGERCYQVQSLDMPDTPGLEALRRSEAAELFCERVKERGRNDFALTEENANDIARICSLLGGLPLALELAAPWVGVLDLKTIVQKLERGLDLLKQRGEASFRRHQSLTAMLDWSYQGLLTEEEETSTSGRERGLLTPEEQALFRRFSVFMGGATVTALEEILAIPPLSTENICDALRGLVEKCMLLPLDKTNRYRILPPLRQYAAEKLTASERRKLMHRHTAWYLLWAVENAALLEAQQQGSLDAFEIEHDNLRAGLNMPIKPEERAQFCLSLHKFWFLRGYYSEASRQIEYALQQGADLAPTVIASLHNVAGTAAWHQEEHEQAKAHWQEAYRLYYQLSDQEKSARAMNNLGLAARKQADYSRAVKCYATSIAIFRDILRQQPELQGQVEKLLARALLNLSVTEMMQEQYEQSEQHRAEGEEIGTRLNDAIVLATARQNAGDLACHRGDYVSAQDRYRESLKISWSLDDGEGVIQTLVGLCRIARFQSDWQRAARLAGGIQKLRHRYRETRLTAEDLAKHDEDTDIIRATIGEEALAALLQSAMNTDTSANIAYALGKSD